MKKYIIKLNIPLDEIIETRFNEADIFITYKPKLDDYMIFVKTNHDKERIMSFDWVEEVRDPRSFSFII